MSSRLIAIAPFSRLAKELLDQESLTLEDLAYDPLLEQARLLIANRLMSALRATGIRRRPDFAKPMNEVYSYLGARLVAANVGKAFLNRLANYEAKRFYELSIILSPDEVVDLARNTFGMRIRAREDYEIDILSYLKGVRGIGGDKWRLVNRVVRGGYVLVDLTELRRIISEYVKENVLNTEEIDLPEPLADMAREFSSLFAKRMRRRIRKFKKGEFPPCMREIIDQIRRGENVTHQGRFAVTAFLLKVGWSVDQILELFKSFPDYNEKIASYQVNHIARKGYTPPKCDTMRSWGLCPYDCGRKHPLEGLG